MADRTISSLFDLAPRYLRSTHLERDFHDPRALDSYILTEHGRECLHTLARSAHPGSTRRALRLTGDYGSGKSSFALFAAHWLSGRAPALGAGVVGKLDYAAFDFTDQPRFVPVLVTGSREPLGVAILRALARMLTEQRGRGPKSRLLAEVESRLKTEPSDEDVERLLLAATDKCIADGHSGLFLVLDELGKFLEFAAYHPERQDVFLLQRLAEAAARSGKHPFLMVGLLHQAFDAYADTLSAATQREWEKIAGRFDEMLFDQPLAQVTELMAAALRVDASKLKGDLVEDAARGFKAARELGWLGASFGKADPAAIAKRLYPIHATVLPVLVRVFSRFGQNERSLFSFLLAHEPHSLQHFAGRSLNEAGSYRLPEFYDYVRTNLGRKLGAQSYRSHWNQIEALVESFASGDPLEHRIMKVVGLLNLLDHPDLVPTDEAILAALTGSGGATTRAIQERLELLTRKRGALFRRGLSGSYRLWSHASVDLQGALEKATKVIGSQPRVGRVLREYVEARPVVARRHYIRTGNLRYFDVVYSPVEALETSALPAFGGDGMVIVALCESAADCTSVRAMATKGWPRNAENVLLAVPRQPLAHLAGLVAEVQRWEWVAANTHELQTDTYARQEVSRALSAAKLMLQRRLENLIGLRSLRGGMELQWYHCGKELAVADARDLLKEVSVVCDRLFAEAPEVKNELVNRGGLSSAAAAARMRLIERIFEFGTAPLLGMDPARKPPEMSIYRSVLERPGLHKEHKGKFALGLPSSDKDVCGVLPTFAAIRLALEEAGEQRLNVAALFSRLGKPPVGVRAGLAPIYFAVHTALHADELAFFEENSFVREVGGPMFQRLLKSPESFEVQLCRVKGLRNEVFDALVEVLGYTDEGGPARLLQVVRPLCQFVARLPDYARSTKRLSAGAIAVRDAILASKEPARLLFYDLPTACGHTAFTPDAVTNVKAARSFALTLKRHVDELRDSYSSLLLRMRAEIQSSVKAPGVFAKARIDLAARAKPLTQLATDPALRTFCLRLGDAALDGEAWLESLGSLIAAQPPKRWRDIDEDTFVRELANLAARFRNLESIVFDKSKFDKSAQAFRLAVTRSDGEEAHEVVYVETTSMPEVNRLSAELKELMAKRPAVALAAISNVVWHAIHGGGKK